VPGDAAPPSPETRGQVDAEPRVVAAVQGGRALQRHVDAEPTEGPTEIQVQIGSVPLAPSLYIGRAEPQRIGAEPQQRLTGRTPLLAVDGGVLKDILEIAAGRLDRRHKPKVHLSPERRLAQIVDRGDIALLAGVAVMTDGGARLDQAQTTAPHRQTASLAAPLSQLSVGPQGQHVADPLSDKARRGQGR